MYQGLLQRKFKTRLMAEDSLGITKNHIAAQKTSQNESDQHLISPFKITHESNIKVMRIKEMIIN